MSGEAPEASRWKSSVNVMVRSTSARSLAAHMAAIGAAGTGIPYAGEGCRRLPSCWFLAIVQSSLSRAPPVMSGIKKKKREFEALERALRERGNGAAGRRFRRLLTRGRDRFS